MSPIIRTHRSRPYLLLDTLLTALGWLGFSYLMTAGIVAVLSGVDQSFELSVMGNAMSTTTALLLYVTIAAVNALVLVLWGTYRKRVTRIAPNGANDDWMDETLLANRFALSSPQMQDIQLSRLLVIHHADSGEISRWESTNTPSVRLSA